MKSESKAYKDAGVDITAGYKSVELMKKHVDKTMNKNVISGLGGFGGLFELDIKGMKNPVLVSGTDGVGTKLKLAFIADKHDTIGIDCVAMCVNDIICAGARPIFFLDYIACGKNVPQRIEQIVKGVADGCVMAGCALIGGETAEMPGFYSIDEYDLAGYSTGVVDKNYIIDNKNVQDTDVIIALPSSGVHSNGFSLVRKIFDISEKSLQVKIAELGQKNIVEELLTPTKIYVKPVLALKDQVKIKSISHITGGGFYENIPRSIPDGYCAKIEKSSLKIPPIFDVIQKTGKIEEKDMYNTFNMGVGMCVVVSKHDADRAIEALKANEQDAYIIGEVVKKDSEKIVLY